MKKTHSYHDYSNTHGVTDCGIDIKKHRSYLRNRFLSTASSISIEVSSRDSEKVVTCGTCIKILKKEIAFLQKRIGE